MKKRKAGKRITALLAAAVILGQSLQQPQLGLAAGSLTDTPQAAASLTDKSQAAGSLTDVSQAGCAFPDMRLQVYETEALYKTASIRSTEGYKLSKSEWAYSGSDYYFSLLTTAEKKLYISLKKEADLYMTENGNFQETQVKRNGRNVQIYILPPVSYEGLTLEEMKLVYNCFLFENPQYYFLRNSIVWSEDSQTMSVGLYGIFANGTDRAAYTEQLREQLDVWEQQVEEETTITGKESRIHQIVCETASYNTNAITADPDDIQMTQSCISAVLFDHTTLCAGYAQLFTLLCNRVGIQCITVTSQSHAWNLVRMGGIWYAVDCTWDDMDGSYVTTYLNVTESSLRENDTMDEHVMEFFWQEMLPDYMTEFDEEAANGVDFEINVTAPEKMKGISAMSKVKERIQILFDQMEGCDGYLLQYSDQKNMSPNKRKLLSHTKCNIIGLQSGKSYYVRIRGYALDSNGERHYGAYSNKLLVTVK